MRFMLAQVMTVDITNRLFPNRIGDEKALKSDEPQPNLTLQKFYTEWGTINETRKYALPQLLVLQAPEI